MCNILFENKNGRTYSYETFQSDPMTMKYLSSHLIFYVAFYNDTDAESQTIQMCDRSFR